MNTNFSMKKVNLLIVFLMHCLFLQAQNITYINGSGKKINNKENAIAMYEIRPIDENSFSIYKSLGFNGTWSTPWLESNVIKKTERTYHQLNVEKPKNGFQIIEIIDTLALGFKIKQTNENNEIQFIGDALQLFPLVLHGKSTFFDKEGMPMAERFFNSGAQINEVFLFNPSDSNVVITQLPEYPGGSKVFYTEIAKSIKYPVSGQLNNLADIVYVKFLIDVNGEMTQIHSVNADSNVLTKEGKRAISSIDKKWEPALSNGTIIPVWHYAKIKFGGSFIIE
jgi:hypothetical protein